MNDTELSDQIESLCEDNAYAWLCGGVLNLDGHFTIKELHDIVELLKTERKELI